eukprot:8173838-Pyramimonas_sp.AAC.2
MVCVCVCTHEVVHQSLQSTSKCPPTLYITVICPRNLRLPGLLLPWWYRPQRLDSSHYVVLVGAPTATLVMWRIVQCILVHSQSGLC